MSISPISRFRSRLAPSVCSIHTHERIDVKPTLLRARANRAWAFGAGDSPGRRVALGGSGHPNPDADDLV